MSPTFDPADVPVQPAATVMLVDDRPDLHVLLVHRTATVVFAPDSWVFPGGRVDPEDHVDDIGRMVTGLTDAEASNVLGVDHGGLAWWLAASSRRIVPVAILVAPLARRSKSSAASYSASERSYSPNSKSSINF